MDDEDVGAADGGGRRRPAGRPPRTRDAVPPRWPPCRAAPRSARWCTRCSSTPTRPPPTCDAELLRPLPTSSALGRSPASSPRSWPTALRRRCCDRRSVRSPATRPAGRRRGATGCAELEFELPLAGGDRRGAAPGRRSDDVAALLRRHLPRGDRLRALRRPAGAAGLGAAPLRGYLTGSLDAVLRLAGPTVTRATSSSTTRPTGWRRRRAADRLALPPAGAWRRR